MGRRDELMDSLGDFQNYEDPADFVRNFTKVEEDLADWLMSLMGSVSTKAESEEWRRYTYLVHVTGTSTATTNTEFHTRYSRKLFKLKIFLESCVVHPTAATKCCVG